MDEIIIMPMTVSALKQNNAFLPRSCLGGFNMNLFIFDLFFYSGPIRLYVAPCAKLLYQKHGLDVYVVGLG